ncbi:acetylxylan esterase [Streptomyces sp. NBC_01298]|uniref:acetylxylan esterase n=1 Tax=Streptomyces sp. NBC_01298 TaxID=2903817 RepID=UPI002E10D942|nr:acetylxylan esterase [Streptomyces sp. NBC_01298]
MNGLPTALAGLRSSHRTPADFDAFWQDTLAEAVHPLDPVFTPVPTALTAATVHDVSFAGSRGHRIAAWLIVPGHPAATAGAAAADQPPVSCVVQFLGYGEGRGAPLDWLLWPAVGRATLVVDTRGQGGANLRPGDTPDPVGQTHPHIPGFVTRGLLDPAQYYYRDAYVDAVRAVDTALAHPAVDPRRVAVSGCSQGGLLALAAAALHEEVAAALVESPFLCDVTGPDRLPDRQPYRELLRFCQFHPQHAGRALETLAYFDGIPLAERASCPALFSLALRDQVCSPSSVATTYHHYAGPKQIGVWPFAGHAEPNGYQRRAEVDFLAEALDGRPAAHGLPSSAAPVS